MLLRIGNEIINTNQLIYAELKGEGSDQELYVRLGGGGANQLTYTARTYKGEMALNVWNVLSRESEFIPAGEEG